MVKVSIITVNLNNSEGLKKTLESVWKRQKIDGCSFEQIVIDGGSTDGSVEVIDQYRDRLAYSVSEPDRGIYNAMNKGIAIAEGEYLLFLNSGDYLLDNLLSYRLFKDGDEDIITGDCICFTNTKTWTLRKTDHPNLQFFIDNTLCHQTSFIKRNLFDNCRYNENFKIVSDWEFFMQKIVFEGHSVRYIPVNVCYYDATGVSSVMHDLAEQERKIILSEKMREHAELFCDAYRQQQMDNTELLCYLFKSNVGLVKSSPKVRKLVRRWVKPLFWFYNNFR